MTRDEKVLGDVAAAMNLAIGCICKAIEQQTKGTFQRRGVATSILDAANAIPKGADNRELMVAVMANLAATLNEQPTQIQPLPFPKIRP